MPPTESVENNPASVPYGVSEMVANLNSFLGVTLVATLANVSDRTLPPSWAREGALLPNGESLKRLFAAQRIWFQITEVETETIARVWFIGKNPELGGQAPVMALREGKITETELAAKIFTKGSWPE